MPPSNTTLTARSPISGGAAATWPSFTSPSPRPPPTPSPRPRVPLSPRPGSGGAASAAVSPSRRRWRKGLLVANGLAVLYGSACAVNRVAEAAPSHITDVAPHFAPHLATIMDHVPSEFASPIRFAAAALPFAPAAVSTFAVAAGRVGDGARRATTASSQGAASQRVLDSTGTACDGNVSPPVEERNSTSKHESESSTVVKAGLELAAYSFLGDLLSQFTNADTASTPMLLLLSVRDVMILTLGFLPAAPNVSCKCSNDYQSPRIRITPMLSHPVASCSRPFSIINLFLPAILSSPLPLQLLILPVLQLTDRLRHEPANDSPSNSNSSTTRTSRAPLVSALIAMLAIVAASGATTTSSAAAAGPSALLSTLGQSLPLSTPWPVLACLLSLVALLRCEAHCTRFNPLSLTAVQTSSLASLSLLSSLLFHLLSSSSAFPHGILPETLTSATHMAGTSGAALLPLIYSGLMCSGLGTWMEMHCLQDLPAPALMLIFTSIPGWGGLLAALAQGEVPEAGLGVAGLVIAAVNAGAWALVSRHGTAVASDTSNSSSASSGGTGSNVNNGSCGVQEKISAAGTAAEIDVEETAKNAPPVPVEQLSNSLVASQLKVPFYSTKAKSLLLKLKLKAKVAGAKVIGGKLGVKAAAAGAYSASHVLTSAVGSGSFGAGAADAAAAAATGTADALSSLGGGMAMPTFVSSSSSSMSFVDHAPKVSSPPSSSSWWRNFLKAAVHVKIPSTADVAGLAGSGAAATPPAAASTSASASGVRGATSGVRGATSGVRGATSGGGGSSRSSAGSRVTHAFEPVSLGSTETNPLLAEIYPIRESNEADTAGKAGGASIDHPAHVDSVDQSASAQQSAFPMPPPPKPPALTRSLSLLDLILLGIGASIGSGIFVVTGVAARLAGPAVSLSFLLAGLASLLNALCYADLAARFPGRVGGAYLYAHACLGQLASFVLFCHLVLDYHVGAAAIARSLASYLASLVEVASGTGLPGVLAPGGLPVSIPLPFLSPSWLLWWFCHLWSGGENGGEQAMLSASALVFFSYIGFDAVANTAEESLHPRRDVPRGLLLALAACSLLYISVSLVLTGMVPYTLLDPAAPLSTAFASLGLHFMERIIDLGAVVGLTTTLLTGLYVQSRMYLALARDGMLHVWFLQVNAGSHVPVHAQWWVGGVAAAMAAMFDVGKLSHILSVGVLLGYSIVCMCVLALRVESHHGGGSGCVGAGEEGEERLDDALLAQGGIVTTRSSMTGSGVAATGHTHVPPPPHWITQWGGDKWHEAVVYVCALVASVLALGFATRFAAPWLMLAPLFLLSLASSAPMFLAQRYGVPASGFACPWVPFVPLMGICVNMYLLAQTHWVAWVRLFVLTVVALVGFWWNVKGSIQGSSG
ncbi:unnamed protein product [Closterium sp. NIES-65]|nr:unnamed protein product [Closterium sp. NIES-65]